MSRRDTIIIAVLINIGLLAFLFMLAVNTDDDQTTMSELTQVVDNSVPSSSSEVISAPTPVALTTPPLHPTNDVDNFLKDLSTQETSQPLVMDDDGFVELDKEVPVVVKKGTSTKGNDEGPYVEVTVKRGDALEKIARSNGTTVEEIKKVNNLTSTKLSIGQVLKVPVSATKSSATISVNSSKPTPSPLEKEKVSSDPEYYTVKTGDSPWKIARQFKVNFEELLKLNNLDEEKARNLKVGDKIRVR